MLNVTGIIQKVEQKKSKEKTMLHANSGLAVCVVLVSVL